MTDTSWYPKNYYIQPHYSTMPAYLRVVDAGASQLTGKRLAFWRRCRDSGLAEWAPTGIVLRVRENADKAYAAQRVTLNLADPQTGLPAGHCFEDCPPLTKPGSDWVHIDPKAFEGCYRSRVTADLKYYFAHEFGHSLGFGHGGDGIMDQTPDHAVVNDEEIAAMKAYWGT